METRLLGRSGVAVTRFVLGCGNFGVVGSSPAFFGQGIPHDVAFRIMDTAWDLGIRAFDTADAYGGGRSESWIGERLATKGGSMAGLALAWLLAQDEITAIVVGPGRPEHLEPMREALELELDGIQAARLAELFA